MSLMAHSVGEQGSRIFRSQQILGARWGSHWLKQFNEIARGIFNPELLASWPFDDAISTEGHSCLFERLHHGRQLLHLNDQALPATRRGVLPVRQSACSRALRATELAYVVVYLSGSGDTLVTDAMGVVWHTRSIAEAEATVSIFTMIFMAALSTYKTASKVSHCYEYIN